MYEVRVLPDGRFAADQREQIVVELGVALATMESEWIVHGRPSTSETLAPASAASSPPAAAWMADVQKRTYAATRPDAT